MFFLLQKTSEHFPAIQSGPVKQYLQFDTLALFMSKYVLRTNVSILCAT